MLVPVTAVLPFIQQAGREQLNWRHSDVLLSNVRCVQSKAWKANASPDSSHSCTGSVWRGKVSSWRPDCRGRFRWLGCSQRWRSCLRVVSLAQPR